MDTHLSGQAGEEAPAVKAKDFPAPVLFSRRPAIFLFPTFTLEDKRRECGAAVVIKWQRLQTVSLKIGLIPYFFCTEFRNHFEHEDKEVLSG